MFLLRSVIQRYHGAMLFGPNVEPLDDDELATILREALRIGGGQITRSTELFMVTVAAEHLVSRLAAAGLRVIRLPPGPPLTD